MVYSVVLGPQLRRVGSEELAAAILRCVQNESMVSLEITGKLASAVQPRRWPMRAKGVQFPPPG